MRIRCEQSYPDACPNHRSARWIAVTGNEVATDRLLFQPDWNARLSVDVREAEANRNVTVVGKGSRSGSSFDPNTPSIVESYAVVNTSLGYRRNGFTVNLFANNLLVEEYFESFIDGSLLQALGLLNQDLGILGAPRSIGVRLQYGILK